MSDHSRTISVVFPVELVERLTAEVEVQRRVHVESGGRVGWREGPSQSGFVRDAVEEKLARCEKERSSG